MLDVTLQPHPCALIPAPVITMRDQDLQTMLDVTLQPHPCALIPAPVITMRDQPPATLAALLDQIARRPGAPAAMLGTTAAHLARYIGAPATDLKLDTLDAALPGFAAYLGQITRKNGSPLMRNSIRSYVNYAHILLALGRESGWSPAPTPAELAWPSVLGTRQTAQFPKGCAGLVRFACQRDKTPETLDDADLDAFVPFKSDTGRRPKYARKIARAFGTFVAEVGLTSQFPRLSPPRRDYFFGITADQMPEPLRSEVRALVDYKLRPTNRRLPRLTRNSNSRLRRGVKIRAVSARALEGAISRIFGFAVKEMNLDPYAPITLLDVADERTVDSYIDFQLDQRGASGSNFNGLRMLHAALRQFPAYKHLDFSWLTELLATIPAEDEEAVASRKSEFCIPWADLCAIQGKLAVEKARATPGTVGYARLAHDQLFMAWMVTFVWRGLNVRTCMLDLNLFKGRVDLSLNLNVDEWVRDALTANPNAAVWQICFGRDEVKAGESVRGFVPQRLVQRAQLGQP